MASDLKGFMVMKMAIFEWTLTCLPTSSTVLLDLVVPTNKDQQKSFP